MEDINRALNPQHSQSETTEASAEINTEKLAEKLLYQVQEEGKDFWSTIYQPYTKQDITRDVILKLLEKARAEGATNMPKLARLLNVCDPDKPSAEERRVFSDSRIFSYKTVRI